MDSEQCPNCGAGLRLETRGELLDKIQVCRHCDFERDVLDEVTIQQEENGKKSTVHRRDLGSQDVSNVMLGNPDIQSSIREMTGIDMADLLSNATSIHGSGKKIVRSTTTTQTFTGPEAEQMLAEMGIDLDQVTQNSRVQAAEAAPATRKRRVPLALGVLLLCLLAGLLVVVITLSILLS